MPLIFNDPAFLRDAIGMPLSHAAAFRSAATSQRCVIISRHGANLFAAAGRGL
jgi:hypothetical protein